MNVRGSAEQIATTFQDWLQAEVEISGKSRNSYLDAYDPDPAKAEAKYRDLLDRLTLGWGNDENWSSKKELDHINRLPLWFEAYQLNPFGDQEAEYQSARLLFGPLMFISGSHRVESYLKSSTRDEYLKNRARDLGIDLEVVVYDRLRSYLVSGRELSEATIDIDFLSTRLETALRIGERAMKLAHSRLLFKVDIGESESRCIEYMEQHQRNWARFATDCVVLAAKHRRGELEAVPFLEPVSISDQSETTHYPLRRPVNWLEVLAT